ATVSVRDKGLLQAMVYQTIRHFWSLQADANSALKKPMRNKDSDVFCLLLVGLCQIKWLNIPDHAAVDATVSATRILKKEWAGGMLNAVLRRAAKGELQPKIKPQAQWDHPQWFIDRLRTAWPEQWQVILTANQLQGPMTLRVNTHRGSREAYSEALSAAGIDHRLTDISPYGITLTAATDVQRLPGFNHGEVSVQDEAAQMAAHWLAPQPGERILDACAAPGGKTGHILELISGEGTVTALDANGRRLERVGENLNRLGYHATQVTALAEHTEQYWDGVAYDRILLDVPCSGTGVIRRHPDIKLLRRPEDIAQLVTLQAAILKAVWGLLKPGGTLLYTTCSVLPQENEQQVAEFLATFSDATLETLSPEHGLQRPFGQQWLPTEFGADGFYYARLRKTEQKDKDKAGNV
ncbi:MAG: 16S rRNA (cytosine(967)-C(5))-methyltransferase RsmB, partial [Natronospirillum sp.]